MAPCLLSLRSGIAEEELLGNWSSGTVPSMASVSGGGQAEQVVEPVSGVVNENFAKAAKGVFGVGGWLGLGLTCKRGVFAWQVVAVEWGREGSFFKVPFLCLICVYTSHSSRVQLCFSCVCGLWGQKRLMELVLDQRSLKTLELYVCVFFCM